MAIGIGVAFLALLVVGWLVGRLMRPPKVNRVSQGWIEAQKYDRRQQRPD